MKSFIREFKIVLQSYVVVVVVLVDDDIYGFFFVYQLNRSER